VRFGWRRPDLARTCEKCGYTWRVPRSAAKRRFRSARRRPRNPMGWLLAAIGILILLTVAGGYYAVLVYRLRDRLPLGPLALVSDVFWEPAILALPLVILLFPDGRLPSRRWRWTLEAYLGLAAGYAIALIWAAMRSAGAGEPVDASGGVAAVDHPAGWLAAI
jgi:hypothetical protein